MIGIIILNYNSWDYTFSCIKSVYESLTELKYFVYLVDNGSIDQIPTEFESYFDKYTNIKLIKSNKNLGFSGGMNLGIEDALKDGCNFLIITNNDVIFFEDSLENFVNATQKYGKSVIIGPQILTKEGALLPQGFVCKKTGISEKYLVRTFLRSVFRKTTKEYYGFYSNLNEVHQVYAVSGCCFLITRDCALNITPFDDHCFLYEEELIIGINMENLGYETYYDPSVKIVHFHGKSSSNIKAFSFTEFVLSEIYYCTRYLQANILKVFPLYMIRVVSYFIRMFKDKDYIRYCKTFFQRTLYRIFIERKDYL